MLREEEFGPVRYYQISRSVGGRHIIDTGVYRIGDLLIDTGPARSRKLLPRLLEAGPINRIVLTHHHEDHVGNAAALAAQQGCTPYIHPFGVPLVAQSPRLPLYRNVVWGTPEPVRAEPLGETFETERYCFRVIHTPGHAEDHVALHEPDQDWLFTGDLYLGDRIRYAFEYEDIGEVIRSIRTLLAVPDCVLFCQHTGYHAGHQHRLGRKLDFWLGLQQKAVMHLEEGRSIGEITSALGLKDRLYRFFSRGEWSARNLVRGLLRDAGKID